LPHSTTQQGRRDSGLLSLALIARYYHLPAEPEALRYRFCEPGKTMDAPALVRAARQLGLKARCLCSNWRGLEQAPLPAIVRQRDGRFIVIARVRNGRALIQDPEAQRPVTLPREALESAWSGEVILFTRRGGTVDEAMRFGFRWFLPAILRHRRLFGEVLLASFFVQLFALVTPLFFQVVIDKVLVHQGLTTLDVLAFGLLVVSLFEVILGGLRTYVFAHTANCIDVLLGARLFRHLFALPLSYFESRRVGDSVARVRELENIRNFITGSALTVVVDVFFTADTTRFLARSLFRAFGIRTIGGAYVYQVLLLTCRSCTGGVRGAVEWTRPGLLPRRLGGNWDAENSGGASH
jgi:subfamily B ATP-binding cassette protein HlyB/CyaB